MPPVPQPPYVPNTNQVLPTNLRYKDDNGDLVTSLFPLDYIIQSGQVLSNTITLFNSLNTTVNLHSTEITALQVAVGTIPAPYTTPQINGQCLNGNQVQGIDVVLLAQVTAWCNYLTVTGSQAALASVLGFQCSGLNSAKSFATGGQMAAITGWVSSPATIADSLKNLWLTVCDLRAGMVTALAQSAPTCANAIIGYAGVYNPGVISLYFSGYTFIPSGFTDNGSIIKIYDINNNLYQTSINLVSYSTNPSPFNISLSGTTLSPSSNYTVYLQSNLINSSLGLTCQKTTIQTIQNLTAPCPLLGVSSTGTSITVNLTPYITNNVAYKVELLDASGTTVLQNTIVTNPQSPQIIVFSGLTISTTYRIRVLTSINGNTGFTCPDVIISTLSS